MSDNAKPDTRVAFDLNHHTLADGIGIALVPEHIGGVWQRGPIFAVSHTGHRSHIVKDPAPETCEHHDTPHEHHRFDYEPVSGYFFVDLSMLAVLTAAVDRMATHLQESPFNNDWMKLYTDAQEHVRDMPLLAGDSTTALNEFLDGLLDTRESEDPE